jgi:hypothetical protein
MNALLGEVNSLQEKCLAYSKSKVDIAAQNYDIVPEDISFR